MMVGGGKRSKAILQTKITGEGTVNLTQLMGMSLGIQINRERDLVTLDAVFEALGVKVLSEIAALTKFFMNFAGPIHERSHSG